MESKNDAFILNLKINSLASSNEVHDAILEEIIRVNRGRKESESRTVSGIKKAPCCSKRIPLANDLIEDVAVNPPYVGVLMKNGKVCRLKLLGENEEIELKSACSTDSTSKPWVQESGLPECHLKQTRNDKPEKASARPKEDTNTGHNWKNDDKEAVDQKQKNLLVDLDFPVISESPKRARLDESADENISRSYIVGLPTVGIIEEQSFEERRFAELIGLGMSHSGSIDVRRILEREQQISSLEESNPFSVANLSAASVNEYDDMSTEGSLLEGSAVLADPQNDVNLTVEDMEEEGLPVTSLPSVGIDPPAMLSNTKVMLSGRNSRSTVAESGGSPSRKRSYPFPDGFRSLSDRLNFIDKTKKAEMPSSSGAKIPQPNTIWPGSNSELKISQLEWLQCDHKDIQFSSISATYSEFVLVTKADGKLWSWPIPKVGSTQSNLKAVPHPKAKNLNLDDEKIRLIYSNIIQTSLVTDSGKIASFFDPIFSGLHQRHLPSLIQRLSQPATYYKELNGENIIDVKCGHLFSVALTESGKVFWWGLSPEQAKTAKKMKKLKRRSIHESFLQVGDTVALKERKEEIGAIVMNSCFIDGPKIGKIIKIIETERNNEASDRKNYAIEILTTSKVHQASPSKHREMIWSSDEVIFLEERACTVGTVVGLDGHYAVISPTVHTSRQQPDDKQFKVCFRSSLVRVSNSGTKSTASSNEFSINEDRYENAIRDSPCIVVDPNGTEEQYNGYKAVAVAASKHGISMLLNRQSDQKAFLVHPDNLKEDNSKVFTCSKRSVGHEKEFLRSDSNVTSEFEAVSATQCQLDIGRNVVHAQQHGSSTIPPRQDGNRDDCTVIFEGRSFSQNETVEQDCVLRLQNEGKADQQKESHPRVTAPNLMNARVTAPNLITLDNPDTTILLDRNQCLFPIKYNSCLLQSGTLDVPPMRILKVVETKFGDEERGEITITIVAAPKKLKLVPKILKNERSKFEELLQAIRSEVLELAIPDCELPSFGEKSSHSKENIQVCGASEWLYEKYSGNQNVLHVCAGHIDMMSDKKHDKPSEGNYMLQSLLACEEVRSQLISLLKEQDSLGCTPFMTAVWTRNSRAALCILRSVLAWGSSDETLFNDAICRKSVSGMTPLHHLVFNLSPLAPNAILKNSLIVSNIPANYSPQMLLQLFKERYASAYRACIPVPTDKWQIKTAKEKLIQTKDGAKDDTIDPPVPQKMGHTFVPRYERSLRSDAPPQQSARARYAILNRTDALRASLKKGIIMFSDMNEMNQALAEMDQYPLICKDERSPPGLMSVARYLLQVRRADDPNHNRPATMVRDDPLLGPRPTRHTVHPSLQGSMRFPRGHLFTDAALSRDIAHVRHILPQTLPHGSHLIVCEETEGNQANNISQTSKRKTGDPLANGNSKQELDTESEDVLDVITELLDVHPEVSSLVNDQQETAMAYYLKNAERLTPCDLHKLFAKWRPCQASKRCLLNRLKYLGIRQNVTVKSSFDQRERSSAGTAEGKPVVCPKPMDIESPQCSSQRSTAMDSPCMKGMQISSEDSPKLLRNPYAPTGRLPKKAAKLVPSYQLLAASNSPSRRSEMRLQHRSMMLSRSPLDEDLPSGLPEVKLRPTMANQGSPYEANSIDELESLAALCSGKPDNIAPFDSRFLANSQKTSLLGIETGNDDRETKTHVCTCRDNLMKIKELPAMNFISMLSMWCVKDGVVGTIFGKSVTKLNDSDPYLSAEELDIIISNLMSNAIPSVVRTFVNTLLQMFRMSKSPDCSLANYCFVGTDLGPISQDLDFVILETYKRFLSSVVRQLSLCLSKDNSVDSGLRHRIGQNAKSKEQSEGERILKSVRLCLRSFSWLAVIEILKAAETAIRPVRLGIAKAQPRGIMSGLRGMGERNPTMQNNHALFGTGARLATANRRFAESYRSSSHIKVASRKPQQSTTQTLQPTRMIRRDSGGEIQTAADREPRPGTSRDSNTSHVAAGLDNNLGVISPLAWTLDGHIRVSEAPRGRSLPLPDFLDNRPDPDSIASIHAGNCYLAQMFCRLVKEAVDLASDLMNEDSNKYCPDEEIPSFEFSASTEDKLKEQAKIMLCKTWKWLFQIMDSLEIQLNVGDNFDTQRFAKRSLKLDTTLSDGAALGRAPNMSQSYVSRPEEYLMYLLRAGNGDAEETFPILDLMSYSHVTFVLDAYFYLLKKWPGGVITDLHQDTNETLQPDNQAANENIHSDVNSTSRDELNGFFGFANKVFEADIFKERQQEVLRKARSPQFWLIPLDAENGNKQAKNDGPREERKSKWKLTISAFAKLFLAETPGLERECFLAEYAGSAGRVARFQRILASLKEECLPKSITEESRPFAVSIRRDRFLFDGLRALNPGLDIHPYSSVNVRFEGEEGTGPGVNRGFFTGFANALTSEKYLNQSTTFLHQPGQLPEQARVFAPCEGSGDSDSEDFRLKGYEGIGRFLGLSLWFNQAIPLIFTKPVLKFLLEKENEITFNDLAFHNSTLYSSFGQMLIDSYSPDLNDEEFEDIYCCNFEFTTNGTTRELVPGGSRIKVTKKNTPELVRLSAMHIMIEVVRPMLEGIRNGLQQIVPKELLDPLNAEDFQSLLSGGVADVNFSRMKSLIRFNNSRSCSKESLERIKGWFWSIVHEMSPTQRMKLLYFLTGSAVLPAFDNKVGNNEELAVTVDIVGQSSTSLPVVSTCGQRLSLPLYESKKELKRKLFMAIECDTYGLG